MKKLFELIIDSEWMTKQDRDDFARYCYIYSKYIKPEFGHFNWEDQTFNQFCKVNKIQKKGNKRSKSGENHFWFNASKPDGAKDNDIAHHFLRHIRNAFAHGLIEISYKGEKRQKYYIIRDFEHDGIQSMNGVIRSDLLWEMIWLIYKTHL